MASVVLDAERGEADVYVREDADDLMRQIVPEAHLAFVELMRADVWQVEDEEALRVWLTHRIARQGDLYAATRRKCP